jgi:hypothetical protein
LFLFLFKPPVILEMPQFDIFSFSTQINYVFIIFIGFYWSSCYFICPSIAAILKARNIYQTFTTGSLSSNKSLVTTKILEFDTSNCQALQTVNNSDKLLTDKFMEVIVYRDKELQHSCAQFISHKLGSLKIKLF